MTDLPLPPEAAPDWAWFLDVDGTLIEIAPTPSAIHVPPELPKVLKRLSERHGGALALVSGRSVDNIALLTAPFRFPAAGLHGLEREGPGGSLIRPPELPGLDAVRTMLAPLAGGGVLVEDKGLSLAVHYRQAPERAEECRRIVQAAVAARPEFTLMSGKMVFEIKPAGSDKGSALRDFMDSPPFAGRVPVFVGDDVTDEYGFEAANALGGISVLVGASRATKARFRLDGVEACRAWLVRAST